MAVSKRLRYEVLKRDNHTCRYCGGVAPDVKLTVDHVLPTALGGSDDPSNLVTACADCNAGKSSSNPDAPLVADVEADALRWADAMRRAAEIHAQAMLERDHYVNQFYWAWDEVRGANDLPLYPIPRDYEESLFTFYDYGLPVDDMKRAVRTTLNRRTVTPDQKWRYFCGVCWRTLDDLRNVATNLLRAEG